MNSLEDNCSLKATSRTMHCVGGILAVALLAGPWLLIARPMAAAQAGIRRGMAAESDLQSRAAEIQGRLQQLNDRDRELGNRRREIFERIPDSPREASFLGQISELAARVGFSIRDYRPGSIDNSTTYGQMDVSIVADGSYGELCRFMDGLERLPRYCRLIAVTAQAQDDGAARLRIDLKMRIFFDGAKEAVHKNNGDPSVALTKRESA
jgi:Tfp pilus assembly protein PilO